MIMEINSNNSKNYKNLLGRYYLIIKIGILYIINISKTVSIIILSTKEQNQL